MPCDDPVFGGMVTCCEGAYLKLCVSSDGDAFGLDITFRRHAGDDDEDREEWSRAEVMPGPKVACLDPGRNYVLEVLETFHGEEPTTVEVRAEVVCPEDGECDEDDSECPDVPEDGGGPPRTYCRRSRGTNGDVEDIEVLIEPC